MALKMRLASDKTAVTAGEDLAYNTELENDGQELAEATKLQIDIPAEFEVTKVTIDGKETKEDIRTGVTVGDMATGVKREVKVETVPKSLPVENPFRAVAKAEFTENTELKSLEAKDENEVKVALPESQLAMKVSADKEAVVVTEQFEYTIELENESKETAEDVLVGLEVPTEFVVGKVSVNGITPVTGDITAGTLEVPDILAGNTATVKAEIDTTGVPVENPYFATSKVKYVSNTVDLENEAEDEIGVLVLDPEIEVKKFASGSQVVVGEILKFTVQISNTGDTDFINVKFSDPIHPNFEFISGSVEINGMSAPNFNVQSSESLGPLPAGQSIVVTFDVEVVNDVDGKAQNTAFIKYSYSKGKGVIVEEEAKSNTVEFEIERAELTALKIVTPSADPLMLGDTAVYTARITNTGTLVAEDVVFKDILPIGVKLEPNSIDVIIGATTTTVNNPDLSTGLFVGDLAPGEFVTFRYTVEVTGGVCNGKLVNDAFAEFEYEVKGPRRGKKESNHASTEVNVGVTNFSQLSIGEICVVPCEKPDIEEINDVKVIPEILDSYVVKTAKGKSNEGNLLSGYKLVVNGTLRVFIEYIADLETQPIHSYHCDIPFGKFVILPEDYVMGTEITTSIQIEDIDACMINEREVYTNIIYMLSANICL